MSILITGANGFIGKNLKIFLRKKNIKFNLVGKKFGDLSLKKSWNKIPKAKVLIHLASPTVVDKSINKPERYINNVLKINSNAVNYCIKNNAKLIFPSSVVYGMQKKKILTEKTKPKPNNPYIKAKFLTEKLIKKKSTKNNFCYTILRIFNVYGKYQKKDFIIPYLISGLKKNISLKNTGSSRDFIYIDDVLSAFTKAIKYKKNITLNIGSGKSYKVIDLIKLINHISYKKVQFKSKEIYFNHEAISVKSNISKAKKHLNWRPIITIKEGLRKSIKYYDNKQ